MGDWMDETVGPPDTGAEGQPKGAVVQSRCLAAPPKCGSHELEAEHNGLGRELYQKGLDRIIFEEENPISGEITTVGALTPEREQEREAVFAKWAPIILAARMKDKHNA
jgi:hypothetical protein